MGEAKRHRESGWTGEKRHPTQGARTRMDVLKAYGSIQSLPPVGKVIVFNGLKYFRDRSGNLRKMTPKFLALLEKRVKRDQEAQEKKDRIEQARLEQEYKEKLDGTSNKE
jgi:hypothetical protein